MYLQKNLKKIVFKTILTLIITGIGLFIFFYKLESVPGGFYIDEVLPSYNAYSLLTTGRDEYGFSWPLVLRFYGSFNPPLYTYLTIIPIAKFGLSIFSGRFISVLSGLLTGVVFFGFLFSSGFLKKKVSQYLGTFLLIISPWLILHSRIGYEITLGLLLFYSGVLFCWLGLKKHFFLILGFLFLSFSTYAAYTERFLVPGFIILFLLVFKKKLFLKEVRNYLYLGLFLSFLTQIPNFWLMTTPAFFPKSDLSFQSNNLFYLIREFLSHYLTYFSPHSLFLLGDPDLQRSIPELSVFYPWMIIPYFVGFFVCFTKIKNHFVKLLLILLFISPIPASLTRDPFSIHRAMPLLVPLVLVMTIGIDRLIAKTKTFIWLAVLGVVVAGSLFLLWRSYFVFLPQERAKAWGYGSQQLSEIILENQDQKFLIDNSRIKPLYIQLAFFMKYPAHDLQKASDQTIKKDYYHRLDFNEGYKFANIEIRDINWQEDIYKEQIIVGDELAVSDSQAREHFLKEVFEIKDPIGNIVFRGFKTNPFQKCQSLAIKDKNCL